jgi:hypothetical protein
MATYSLLDNDGVVQHHLVADSAADLGVFNDLFTVVDTTNLAIQPSVGWKLIDGIFHPKASETALAEWHGAGFVEEDQAAVEAPTGLKALFGGAK